MEEQQEDMTKQLREYWLYQAAIFLMAMMEEKGMVAVPVRVSCGWPSRGGMGNGKHVIGQCFPPEMCADGVPQIFISPRIAESIQVLGTLLHELIHAAVGWRAGHKKAFSQPARLLGLEGPPTATTVGAALAQAFRPFLLQMGPYPHAPIQVEQKQKAGSRLRLYECQCEPVIKLRAASDELEVQCLRCGAVFSQVE